MTSSGGTVEDIGSNMTENFELVSNWMLSSKLKLNAGKTHVMTVGTKTRLDIGHASIWCYCHDGWNNSEEK